MKALTLLLRYSGLRVRDAITCERKRLVESEWGFSENNRKAKFYQLTARGRAELKAELTEWQRYTKAVAGVLQPA